jgi:uncharacterized protein (TIGR02231 family)
MVTLDSFQCETKLDHFCCPELAETVVLRSRQRNTGKRPLLAGPVRLVRHGGFIGRGQISFVAPGEPFALGWGSQDELQVSRRGGHTREERGLGRRINHSIWNEVYLSNTGREARTVTVTERIPLSEVDEVQVKLQTDETTPGFRQTPEGHLVWELELRPGGQQELRLAYQVDAHRKVVWR